MEHADKYAALCIPTCYKQPSRISFRWLASSKGWRTSITTKSTTHMAILVIVCRCYSPVCPCCMFISIPKGPSGVRGLPSYPPHHWCAPQCANAVNQRDSKWKIMIMQLIMHWNNESIYRCTILIWEKEGWNQTVNNALSADRHRLTASPSYYCQNVNLLRSM
jgi:hypothetical protein